MEEYFYQDDEKRIVDIGYYSDGIFEKHKKKYGEISAARTRDKVVNIFSYAMNQVNNPLLNNNLLLVGKVQSGKTSNLEMFTALAFDNGYKCVIIYGGYDTKLLNQTSNRFKYIFDIDDQDYSSKSPELISTDDGNAVTAIDNDIIDSLLESEKPIIIVSMKRPNALSKVNSIIKYLSNNNVKTFIIDDEGDQASLNTRSDKITQQSPTYGQIVSMKKTLNNPLYLSVTATPQANVLLGEYSELRPDGLRLISPGTGYTGSEFFLTDDYKIYTIDDDEIDIVSEGVISKSLMDAIKYYIIASAIMIKMNIEYSDMIVHIARNTDIHKKLFDGINTYFQCLKANLENDDPDFELQIKEIYDVYNIFFFKKEILEKYKYEELREEICSVIKKTYIILQDSQGAITQEHEKYRKHKIYVGGDLLQRGLTFEKLVTTFFTRWPKTGGNMDTTIQRARWLGYRMQFIDLCKVFTTSSIKMEYCGLEESEADLWEKCALIENNQMDITDIVIDADSTSLNPTRRNVADYKKVQFNKKWNNQKTGVFDVKILEQNNKNINDFLSKIKYNKTNTGRTDKKTSCLYGTVDNDEFISFISDNRNIFDTEPFNIRSIKEAIKGKKIIFEKFFGNTLDKYIRERSFDPQYRIYALQQGADPADEEKRKYLGDSNVVVDECAVVVQVFRIRPKIDKQPKNEYDQYMFSIHMPEIRKGFVRK